MMPLTAVLEHPVQANLAVTAQIFTNIKDFILTNKERVLVVDDDPAMLRGVARVLRQPGTTASSSRLRRLSEPTAITKRRPASFWT